MAKLFFLVKVFEKLSIAGLRSIFKASLEGKRASQNGWFIYSQLPKSHSYLNYAHQHTRN